MKNEENTEKKKEQLRKELEDIAPTLAAMTKTNPFGIPENYFSSLEYRVMQQIKKAETPKLSAKDNFKVWWTNVIALFSGRVLATAVASMIVLGISLFFLHTALMNAGNRSSDSGLEFSGLSNEELGNYVITHSEEFDLADIDPETLNAVAQNYKMKDAAKDPGNVKYKSAVEDSDQPETEDVL